MESLRKRSGATVPVPAAMNLKAARGVWDAMAAGAILLLSPGLTRAQPTCNAVTEIRYVSGPNFSLPGDIQRVRITLGTGSINGGFLLTINQVRFDLDCNNNFPLVLPCADEGALVEYEGDGTITTTCPGSIVTGHAVSSTPNSIVFTPAPPIVIPPNQAVPPGFCSFDFDVKVLAAPSLDATPNSIEEIGGVTNLDGHCDNGVLPSGGTHSRALPLCPACSDTDCATSACDQNTGQCDTTNVSDGTPCPDTDQNACTIAGCVQGQCVQTYQTSCPGGQGITGKKLLIKSGKFVLLSNDPSISIAGSDPVGGADSSITFDDGSGPVGLVLPKTLWSANGAGTVFKYKNPDAPGGPSLVKGSKVKSGLLKAFGAGAPIPVPNGQASIDVVVSLDGGTNTYCMTFSGTGDGKKFLAKDAPAGTCQ